MKVFSPKISSRIDKTKKAIKMWDNFNYVSKSAFFYFFALTSLSAFFISSYFNIEVFNTSLSVFSSFDWCPKWPGVYILVTSFRWYGTPAGYSASYQQEFEIYWWFNRILTILFLWYYCSYFLRFFENENFEIQIILYFN